MNKRPPNDRGQGRKPLPVQERAVVKSIRLTPAQWARFRELGGGAWLRTLINHLKKQEDSK